MILYNGATGGLGRYLAPALGPSGEASHALIARLEDREGLVAELSRLRAVEPLTFIHLAAMVSVPACQADPVAAHHVNVTLARSTSGTIVDWARQAGIAVRIIYVGTGHVYATAAWGSRLAEDAATRPRSIYAQSKLEAEHELARLCAAEEVPFLVARVFGLIAPLQAEHYVLPGLVRRVRSGALFDIPGLDFARDYLDARDVCEDLLALSRTPWPEQPTVVNVCSGTPVTIRELLSVVVDVMRPGTATDVRTARAAAGRPDDVSWMVGDPSRFAELTGQSTKRISLQQSVADAVAGLSAGRDPI